jgi:hypothetical protein
MLCILNRYATAFTQNFKWYGQMLHGEFVLINLRKLSARMDKGGMIEWLYPLFFLDRGGRLLTTSVAKSCVLSLCKHLWTEFCPIGISKG